MSLDKSTGTWSFVFQKVKIAKNKDGIEIDRRKDIVAWDIYIPNPSPLEKKMIDEYGFFPTYACNKFICNDPVPEVVKSDLLQEAKQPTTAIINKDLQSMFPNPKTSKTVSKIELTPDRWAELNGINEKVNFETSYLSDEKHFGRQDKFSYPTDGFGDCEDYALEKRRQLIELGWPASNLLIAYAETSSGNGHAVLVARTNKGDLVLDNGQYGFESVIHFQDTQYKYSHIQSPFNETHLIPLNEVKGKGYKDKQE